MALAITLKPGIVSLLSMSPENRNRKFHWVGGDGNIEGEPGRRGPQDLSEIRLGDVQRAHAAFRDQLTPSPIPGRVAPGYFCLFRLARKEARPSVIFGRIGACYPPDRYLLGVQQLELYFPRREQTPLTINLYRNDFDPAAEESIQSYCVRVKLFLSAEEHVEFKVHEQKFVQQGYAPEYVWNHEDFTHPNEPSHESFPQLLVVSSRWFASAPDPMREGIREKLAHLIDRGKLIFNYHVDEPNLPHRSLNRELGFRSGFSDVYLTEPNSPAETLSIVSLSFDQLFLQGMR